nr:MAG TPA: hypothetical protein [Caudoviricetes sp.]
MKKSNFFSKRGVFFSYISYRAIFTNLTFDFQYIIIF